MPKPDSWARDAVIYQIYPRSFADADGDGVGDLAGITARLDYVAGLGVDAIWLSPFYPSPMADHGYDVADYRGVDPIFGSLDDFDALLAAAHERDLKVIIDIVPNHTSDQHRWFQEAIEAGPGSAARERYHFRDKPTDGGPPNNLHSVFGGPAWTELDDQVYLHMFAPEQPDLNWEHPEVRAEFADVLRFWLDRGVDGIRIDVADALIKPEGLPDVPVEPGEPGGDPAHYRNLDGVHEIYREWRAVLDEYQPERVAVAEAWSPGYESLADYVRPDELHQAFNFRFLATPWDAAAYRSVIDSSLAAMAAVDAPTTWVLSNHDVIRHASRFGRLGATTAGVPGGANREEPQVDPARGLARARAATLMMLALPGSAYLYQGEELGLPEVFDLPDEVRQDPVFFRTNGERVGRDGCRVPMPWSGAEPPYGFTADGGKPWLPQPADWAAFTVEAQQHDPSATLALYRTALGVRRQLQLGSGELTWIDPPADDLLIFRRAGLVVTTNCGSVPARLPQQYGEPVLTSGPVPELELVPPDTTIWWRTTDR
ncbi:glycoside hydrolase family 13 protein [Natronosporangium hydrolyticum]|uniref:Glycoside hydrolase family 13 protein n=1 Tax=Natronosporangium hydrolyticum TaxID=2811111 RepID=A0A895YCD9_9ACTN|nr:glycoside hydrolase family 13 protein [Natronosporangium hydrolyticum]QSB15457.1 glycoside hydrolase family 13 protein [Natronosporangium hydrolyticum]